MFKYAIKRNWNNVRNSFRWPLLRCSHIFKINTGYSIPDVTNALAFSESFSYIFQRSFPLL